MIFQPSHERISLILSKYQGRKHTIADDEIETRGRKPADAGVRADIRRLLKKSGPMCATDVALALGMGRGSVSAAMSQMRKEGQLRECKSQQRPDSRATFYEVP